MLSLCLSGKGETEGHCGCEYSEFECWLVNCVLMINIIRTQIGGPGLSFITVNKKYLMKVKKAKVMKTLQQCWKEDFAAQQLCIIPISVVLYNECCLSILNLP